MSHETREHKGIADVVRGKIFTRHANLISIAAKKGGDPSMNPALRMAIDSAKKDNVSSATIERAIKRGTGELKGEAEVVEMTYEGYGPNGIAVIVECITNNKNRTFTNLRTAFDKNGGHIGTSGSVAWMFDKKGVIEIDIAGKNHEAMEMAAIDAGAEDLKIEKDCMKVTVAPAALHETKKNLEKQGFKIEKAEIRWLPKNKIEIKDSEVAKKVRGFLEAIENDEDVLSVASNVEIF